MLCLILMHDPDPIQSKGSKILKIGHPVSGLISGLILDMISGTSRILYRASVIGLDIRHHDRSPVGYLTKYLLSGRIFAIYPVPDRIFEIISGTQPNIRLLYPVLGRIFNFISGIWPDIQLYIQYLAGYLTKYLIYGRI